MRLIYLLLVIGIFSACSENDPGSTEIEPKLWVLSEIESFDGNIIAGDDIIFNQSILLNPDKTFMKKRMRDGNLLSESSGTYEFDYQDDATYVYLDHETDNDLITNCTGETRETFFFESDILVNNSSACDWPILRFFEVK